MSVYRLLALRYLLQRWDRAALIVVSIALGVATLVSAHPQSVHRGGGTGHHNTRRQRRTIRHQRRRLACVRSLADELRAAKLPGVRSIQPLVYDRVTLPDLDGRIAVLVGAEVSTQLLTSDNPLKAKVDRHRHRAEASIAPRLGRHTEGRSHQSRTLVGSHSGPAGDGEPTHLRRVDAANAGDKPFVVRHATRDIECLPIGVVDFASDSPVAPLGKQLHRHERRSGGARSCGRLRRSRPPAAGLGEVAAEQLSPRKGEPHRPVPGTGRGPGRGDARPRRRWSNGRADVRTPDAQRRSTQEIVSGLQIGVPDVLARRDDRRPVPRLQRDGRDRRGTPDGHRHPPLARRHPRPDRPPVRVGRGVSRLHRGGSRRSARHRCSSEFTLSQFRSELESMFLNPDVNPTRLSWVNAALAMLAGVATAVFAALVPAIQAASDDPAHVVRRSAGGAKGIWKLIHRAACVGLIATGAAMIAASPRPADARRLGRRHDVRSRGAAARRADRRRRARHARATARAGDLSHSRSGWRSTTCRAPRAAPASSSARSAPASRSCSRPPASAAATRSRSSRGSRRWCRPTTSSSAGT